MSFAVFGITWDYCLKKAQRQVKAYRIENGHRIAKSEAEWQLEVEQAAEQDFERYVSGRGKLPKLSSDMAMPASCNNFIELALATGKAARLSIYQVQPVKGQFHPKTKQPVMRYQPWVGGS
ncbi:hypothetical protein [Shewanella algae]|uniref:hypothetical protein n=1 Tax=Shewanella algae TaxID=38313 RepID=UPI0031F4BD42